MSALDTLEQQTLDNARKLCLRADPDYEEVLPARVVRTLGKDVRGMARTLPGGSIEVLLAREALKMGVADTAATLYEGVHACSTAILRTTVVGSRIIILKPAHVGRAAH